MDPSELPADQTDIRAVSDDFLAEIDALLALEERKRTTPIDDPSFPQLARDIEDGARALMARATDQSETADRVHEEAVAEGVDVTIEEIPPDLAPAEILAMWRDADRQRALVEPGSGQWRALTQRIDRLRTAYQQTFERDR